MRTPWWRSPPRARPDGLRVPAHGRRRGRGGPGPGGAARGLPPPSWRRAGVRGVRPPGDHRGGDRRPARPGDRHRQALPQPRDRPAGAPARARRQARRRERGPHGGDRRRPWALTCRARSARSPTPPRTPAPSVSPTEDATDDPTDDPTDDATGDPATEVVLGRAGVGDVPMGAVDPLPALTERLG